MYVANEGTLVAFVAPEAADSALAALRSVPGFARAAEIEGHPDNVAAAIAAATDDVTGRVSDHGTDRNLSVGRRFFCKRKGFFHPLRLIHLSKITTAGDLPAVNWGLYWCTQEDSNLQPSDP